MSLINMLKPNPQCDAIWRSDLWKLKVEFVLTQDQQVLCNVWQRNGKAMTREPGSQPSSEQNLLAPWSWFPSFQICEKCFYCLEALQSKNFSYSNLNELRHVPATVTPFILQKKKKKRKRFYLSSEASVFWNFDSYSLQAVLPIFLGVNMNTSSSKAYPCLYDLYKAMLSEWDYFCQSLVHFLHNSQILFQLLSCFSFSKTVDEFHMALSLSFPENLYIPDIFI